MVIDHEIGRPSGTSPDDCQALVQQVRHVVSHVEGMSGTTIRVLQQVQDYLGYLPVSAIDLIAKELDVPVSEVYGIVTFYHFFTMVPRGKHVIQVCKGTSCYIKGGQRILDTFKNRHDLEPGGITKDKRFSLDMVRCLGCCGLSPVIAVGTDVYRRVNPNDIEGILSAYE